jgi:predicted outer membrane protein
MHRRQFIAGLMLAASPLAITHTVAQPAPAGAIPAPTYLAMAAQGGMMLEETARDAFEKTQNPNVKRFARSEVIEQVTFMDKVSARMPAGAMAGAAGPGGVVGGLVAAPFAVAGAAVGAAGAVAGAVVGAPGAAPARMMSPAERAAAVAQMRGMAPGPQYDAMFVNLQLMGHQEALAIHGSYAQSGDDPALRRIARSTIPMIRLHISQLSRMQRMMGGAPVG